MPMRVFRLDEDKSGNNPNNLVPNEEHLLPVQGVRFFVTKRGPFYTKKMRITDAATGRLLVPRVDYDCIQLEVEQTAESGQEVCSIVIIRNNDGVNPVGPKVLATYQAYGGWLSYSVTAVIEMVKALNLEALEIEWGQLIGIPDRLPAAPHRHPLSDVYGWHKLFPGLQAIRDAIITGNQPVIDGLREGFEREVARIDAAAAALRAALEDHANATGNVHHLDIHQIQGLTAQEIKDLDAQRLPIQGTAYDTARLYGLTPAAFDPWIHSILSYSRITAGIVPAPNRAEGFQNIPDLVVTAQGYTPFSTMLKRNQGDIKSSGMYWAGRFTSAAAMQAVYANNEVYPAPTMVAYTYYYETTHGYGNGGSYQVGHNNLRIDLKYAPGAWVNISSD